MDPTQAATKPQSPDPQPAVLRAGNGKQRITTKALMATVLLAYAQPKYSTHPRRWCCLLCPEPRCAIVWRRRSCVEGDTPSSCARMPRRSHGESPNDRVCGGTFQTHIVLMALVAMAGETTCTVSLGWEIVWIATSHASSNTIVGKGRM